jgi:hypothetical protein
MVIAMLPCSAQARACYFNGMSITLLTSGRVDLDTPATPISMRITLKIIFPPSENEQT